MTKVMAYNPVVLKSTVIAITKAMASMQRLVNSTVFLLDIFLEVERVGDYINLHFVVKKQWCLRLKKVFRNIDRWKCL